MKEINVDYITLKSLVLNKALLLQYADQENSYFIFATEDSIVWQCLIMKDGGFNQVDFETNYKATANQPLNISSGVGRPIRVSPSSQPANTIHKFKGFQLTIPANTTTAYQDIAFDTETWLIGGNVYTISTDIDNDDYMSMDILVKANDYVLFPKIVDSAFIVPNIVLNFKSSECMELPNTVKVRITATCPNGASEANPRVINGLLEYFEPMS